MEEDMPSTTEPSRIMKPKRKIFIKPPDPQEEEVLAHGNVRWSIAEKKLLLYAVKKFGWRNSDKLVATVGTKNKEQIQRFLLKKQKIWKRVSRIHFTGNVAPVEVWLEKAQKMSIRKPFYARSLSKAFSMMGQHEAFPTPKSPFEPNYPELYEYFAHLLRGNTPTALCEGNRRVMTSLLEMVASILKGTSWTDERQFFAQHPVPEESPSKEAGRNKSRVLHNESSTSSPGRSSSPVSQMECDNSSRTKTESCISNEVTIPSYGSQFEDLKDFLFTDDPDLATLNPFGLPFNMFTRASAKVEQLLMKQNLID